MSLEKFFRTREPFIYLAAIVGVLVTISFWFPSETTISLSSELAGMASVIIFFMMFLGVASQYKVHIPPVLERKEDWVWDAYFIGALTIFLGIALIAGVGSDLSSWVINYIRTPIGLGSSSTYGPLVYRGVLRAVTARNKPVAVMVAVMVVLLFGQSTALYSLVPGMFELNDFVVNRLAAPAVHSAQVIVGLVSCVTAVRVLIGRERGFLGK